MLASLRFPAREQWDRSPLAFICVSPMTYGVTIMAIASGPKAVVRGAGEHQLRDLGFNGQSIPHTLNLSERVSNMWPPRVLCRER